MSITASLPRDNLLRFTAPGVQLRGVAAAEVRSANPFDGSGEPGIVGHFAVFNRWTEIDSLWEGHFLERIAPGTFRRTMKDNRNGMRVLFQHGRDPQVGDKPLGTIDDLSEDDTGARYDVTLFDTFYNRELIPGLAAGQYGASFRFRVMREDVVDDPKPTDTNPLGLPERTIREAKVFEFGPVTFPAYAGATAGVRSMTDDIHLKTLLTQPDKLRALLASYLPAVDTEDDDEGDGDDSPEAPAVDRAEPAHPVAVRRSTGIFGMSRKDTPTWRI